MLLVGCLAWHWNAAQQQQLLLQTSSLLAPALSDEQAAAPMTQNSVPQTHVCVVVLVQAPDVHVPGAVHARL